MHINVIEVSTQKLERVFIETPKILFKNDKKRIVPFDFEVKNCFSEKKNILFQKGGKAKRWIAFNGNNVPLGRIAAFYTKKGTEIGRFGFFECIDNQEVATALLEKGQEWLEEKGFIGVDGMINFGDKFAFWGVQNSGFERGIIYNHNQNPKYYHTLLQSFGFQDYYKQFVFRRESSLNIPEKLQFLFKRKNLLNHTVLSLSKKTIKPFCSHFVNAYNSTFSELLHDFSPAKYEETYNAMKKNLSFLVPKTNIILMVDDKPAAFLLSIPNYNEIIKNYGGKLTIFNMIHFLKNKKKVKSLLGVVVGVTPEFQKSTIIIDLMLEINKRSYETGFKDFYFSWIGDFNPPMVKLMKRVSIDIPFEYITYRKWFDKDRIFYRYLEEGKKSIAFTN